MIHCPECERILGERNLDDVMVRADYWYPTGIGEWTRGDRRRKHRLAQYQPRPPKEDRKRPEAFLYGDRWQYRVGPGGRLVCKCGKTYTHSPP